MERSDELRDVLLRFYDALAAGDLSFFDRHMSGDAGVRGIGTDPDEWWAGPRVAEVFKEQVDATGGMPLKPGDPEAYVEGSVGWVADQATLTLPDGGELRLRFTGCCIARTASGGSSNRTGPSASPTRTPSARSYRPSRAITGSSLHARNDRRLTRFHGPLASALDAKR